MTETLTMNEAMAMQPMWLSIWLNILMFGAFILPLTLFIWKQSRMAALLTIIAGIVNGFAVGWMFNQLGYVKLLGLPHILIWTPLAIYLFSQIKRADMPVWPRRIMWVVLGVIVISLAFDYVDVLRYILGERAPSV